jgi:hypothetical protein
MNDLHGIWLVVAAAAGAIVATAARILPREIDVTYIPAIAALFAVGGGGLAVLFVRGPSVEERAVLGARWGFLVGFIVGLIVYLAALLGWSNMTSMPTTTSAPREPTPVLALVIAALVVLAVFVFAAFTVGIAVAIVGAVVLPPVVIYAGRRSAATR